MNGYRKDLGFNVDKGELTSDMATKAAMKVIQNSNIKGFNYSLAKKVPLNTKFRRSSCLCWFCL